MFQRKPVPQAYPQSHGGLTPVIGRGPGAWDSTEVGFQVGIQSAHGAGQSKRECPVRRINLRRSLTSSVIESEAVARALYTPNGIHSLPH